MFLDRIIPANSNIKSQVCGLEINFTSEGEEYYYTILKKKGKSLDIVSAGKGQSADQIPSVILKNKIPLVLIINGRGIIIKKMAGGANADTENLIAQNIPSVNPNEFVVELYKQGENIFAAICRKEIAERTLSEFRKAGHEIAGVHIGTPAVTFMQPLYSAYTALTVGNYQAAIENGEITEFRQQQSEEKISGIKDVDVPPQNILGFSVGFGYFLQKRVQFYGKHALAEINQKHVEKNKFRFLLSCSVGLLFLLAVCNAVLYSFYYDRSNRIDSELSVYQQKYEEVNKLLDEYGKKKTLIENAGILSDSRLSEYADKLAATVPAELRLSELTFNPAQESEDMEDSLLKFRNKTILIKGNCDKTLVVNDWINVLKMQNFIKRVNLEKFTYGKESLAPNYEISVLFE